MKKTLSSIANWLGKYALAGFFCILVALDLSFRFFYRDCTGVSTLRLQPLIFTVGWALLFCGLICLLPTLGKRIAMIFIVTVQAILCIVHGVMYNLFGSFFSFADLAYAGDGAKFFSFSYLRIRPGALICALLAIACIIFLAIKLPKKPYQKIRQPITALVMVVVGLLCIIIPHKKQMQSVDTQICWDWTGLSEADIYRSQSNVNYALGLSGVYQYQFRSLIQYTGWGQDAGLKQMREQLDEYYAQSEKNNHPDNEMTGIFEGKNVMFVLLESVDTWMLTEDYMPNLYRLQQQSINFVNHYSPMYTSAATFTTEFIANTGMIPPTSGINPDVYLNNTFATALPRLFADKGYHANSFHAAALNIYRRNNIHPNLGYETLYGSAAMGMEHFRYDSELIRGYDLMTKDTPFFSFIITLSGHGPYTDERSYTSDEAVNKAREIIATQDVPLTGNNLEEYTYAISHVMQTDMFFGSLLERMEADGHLDDTVIVCFTDHFGKYMTDHEAVMQLKGVDNSDLLCHTPFFIYSADTPAQTVEKVTSSMDIAPTLANLFNLDVNYAYYVGNDIFSDYDDYVIFRGNNWYDGEIYYSPAYTGEVTDEIKKRNQEVSQRMNMAWDTLRCDYFAK